MDEITIKFNAELNIGDRAFYINPDGESWNDVFEIEVIRINVSVSKDGARVDSYCCRTPFDHTKYVTIGGLNDYRVCRDLQEVADCKFTNHPSAIVMMDSKRLQSIVDVGIKERMTGDVIVPCRTTHSERIEKHLCKH